jgi:hypothetical protein
MKLPVFTYQEYGAVVALVRGLGADALVDGADVLGRLGVLEDGGGQARPVLVDVGVADVHFVGAQLLLEERLLLRDLDRGRQVRAKPNDGLKTIKMILY